MKEQIRRLRNQGACPTYLTMYNISRIEIRGAGQGIEYTISGKADLIVWIKKQSPYRLRFPWTRLNRLHDWLRFPRIISSCFRRSMIRTAHRHLQWSFR